MNFWKQVLSKRMLIVLVFGFASGLPLLLTGATLKYWMSEAGVDLTTIGLFSYVALPYSLKFLWSPLTDRFSFFKMGRRRSWLFLSQLGLAICLATLSQLDPKNATGLVALLALLIAFFSATQDIVIDAHRREILSDEELGLGSSLYVFGYRLAILFTGALALFLADHMPWSSVYLIMAAAVGIGLFTTLTTKEPASETPPPKSLSEAIVGPLKDYFTRDKAITILAFILLFKLGDQMASEMLSPFYNQMGFSKTEVAGVAKLFGIWATILGGVLGGLLILKMGLHKSLWLFGALQSISTLGFSWLSQQGPDLGALTIVIAFENLASGLGTAAFVAFMASLTNRRFSATQYALLTSFAGLSRSVFGSLTGWLVTQVGWNEFFLICTLLAIPGMLLLLAVKPSNEIKT